jgi:hypothetical protein
MIRLAGMVSTSVSFEKTENELKLLSSATVIVSSTATGAS